MNGNRVCWDFGVVVAPARRRPRWWWVARTWRVVVPLVLAVLLLALAGCG